MIDELHAQQLQDQIEAAKQWPPKSEQEVRECIGLFRAMREADAAQLRPRDWDADDNHTERRRPFLVDPLPARVSEAFADLIYGEDPVFKAATEGDQDELDELVEANELTSELRGAVDLSVSEGEVWWRILVDRDRAETAIIEWHSRLNVLPLIRGRKVLAAAMFTEMPDPESENRVWRYFEIHAEGLVRNLLFEGGKDKLGTERELAAHPQTADLETEWRHELPMLVGRIQHLRGRSQYARCVELYSALNEATTVGQENMRLTAKKRVVVPSEFLDQHGRFPAGAEIMVATNVDRDPDKPGQGLAQVEWSFDAEALELYKNGLVDTILTRSRVAPQLVGRHTEGAQTGPALRARLLDSLLAARGIARTWDDKTPAVVTLAQQVSALSVDQGGLGRAWTSATEPPTITRRDALPDDEELEVRVHATAVGAEIESRETAIRALHTDWDDTQISQELDRIDQDMKLVPPPGGQDLPPETGGNAETS